MHTYNVIIFLIYLPVTLTQSSYVRTLLLVRLKHMMRLNWIFPFFDTEDQEWKHIWRRLYKL